MILIRRSNMFSSIDNDVYPECYKAVCVFVWRALLFEHLKTRVHGLSYMDNVQSIARRSNSWHLLRVCLDFPTRIESWEPLNMLGVGTVRKI